MTRNFDHITIVVRDLGAAKRFFGLLGFEEDKAVVISGAQFATVGFAKTDRLGDGADLYAHAPPATRVAAARISVTIEDGR